LREFEGAELAFGEIYIGQIADIESIALLQKIIQKINL
jgi:hypothetical protein